MSKARSNLLREIFRFLGPGFATFFLLNLLVGVSVAGIELLFAFCLQSFTAVTGISPPATLNVPSWLPTQGFLPVTALLIGTAIVRGALYGSQEYLRSGANELYRFGQGSRIIRWALSSPSANSAQVTTLYNNSVIYSCEGIMAIQQVVLLGATQVFVLLSMFAISWQMALLTVLLGFLAFIPLRSMNRSMRRMGQNLAEESANINRRLLMSIKNLLLLRVYNLQGREYSLTQESLGRYWKHAKRFNVSNGLLTAFPAIFGTVLLCVITGVILKKSSLRGGMLLTFFYLFFRFSQNSGILAGSVTRVFYRWDQVTAFFRWWKEQPPELVELSGTLGKGRSVESSSGNEVTLNRPFGWQVSNLEFSYPGAAAPTFTGLKFNASPGTATVITGTSGAGKTTLLNLLLGELTPQKGEVSIDLDGKRIPLGSVRASVLKSIGYVGPETFLFDGSIEENITYGLNRAPSEEEVRSALFSAECQFVFEMPLAVKHRLTEQGHGLSAGQKQRLALARALLREPRALILDEATANLDSKTEANLIDTLEKLKRSMTLIIVTHRPTLLRLADQHLDLNALASAL